MTEKRQLAIVMPVYNEEKCIAGSLSAWIEVLAQLNVDYEFHVVNDGSTDGTGKVLAQFRADERIKVLDKANSGHGPAILAGYNIAIDRASWLFQTDSDMEIAASHFVDMWRNKDGYDAVMGIRIGRQQAISRKLISALSRICVRWLYAPGVIDVNVPYRLMHADILRPILPTLPKDTFAPNIIISGVLSLEEARILNCPVIHSGRKTGLASLIRWRMWKAAWRSFLQLVKFRLRYRRRSLVCPGPG